MAVVGGDSDGSKLSEIGRGFYDGGGGLDRRKAVEAEPKKKTSRDVNPRDHRRDLLFDFLEGEGAEEQVLGIFACPQRYQNRRKGAFSWS